MSFLPNKEFVCFFQLRNMGEKIRRFVFGKFVKKCRELDISYANGLGFYDHFTNGSSGPWKDIRKMDFTNDQYRSPAMMPTFDEYETHGGEDVPLLANGPWAHLFVGVHEESYWCQAIEHAAGWGKYQLPSAKPSAKPNSAISLKSTWILSAVILAFFGN